MFVDIQRRQRAKDVAWQVRWRATPVDKYGYKTFPTKKEARDFIVTSLRALVEAKADPAAHHRVCDAVALWLEIVSHVGRHEHGPVDAATVCRYRERLQTHVMPIVGDAISARPKSLHATSLQTKDTKHP